MHLRYCRQAILVFVVIAFVATVWFVQADQQQQQHQDGEVEDVKRAAKLPKLFDFDFFKSKFEKRYSSLLENLNRRRFFLARSFRVFAAAVKYRWRKLGHFLSLNHMSDYSPQETDKMKNKGAIGRELRKQRIEAKRQAAAAAAAAASEPMTTTTTTEKPLEVRVSKTNELDASDEEVRKTLEEIAREHPNDKTINEYLEKHQASGNVRRKRSTDGDEDDSSSSSSSSSSEQNLPPRSLDLDELIKSEKPANSMQEYSNENGDQVKIRIPSNNPNYEPIELTSRGLDDQQEPVTWFRIKGKNDPDTMGPNSFLSSIVHELREPDGQKRMEKYIPKIMKENHDALPDDDKEQSHSSSSGKADEIFVDHRGTCMGMIRQQGTCGCCYAFALTAMLEWLYCKRTGSYTPFSEQYMIDCGHYVKGLYGCEGGDSLSGIEFVHNFGAELRISYPYRTRRDQCPYTKSTDLKTTGYIRPNIGAAVIIPRRKWGNYIKYTPLVTAIFPDADFQDYGGGVHNLQNCDKDNGHAVLVIGHGREDGQEYWLLRNSYSVGWGDRGYHKLAKSSDPNCIYSEGYTFGTNNGVKFDSAKPEINKQNDHSHVKRRNEANLKQDLANGAF